MSTDHYLPQILIFFSDELTISLSKAVNKFDDLITMGNFNIDITEKIVQDLINWKSYVIRFISQT